MTEVKKEKWIIDCDPGIDDMMAILYMMGHRNCEILMVGTIDGNVHIDLTTLNMKKILKLAKREIPIHRGSNHPIIKQFNNDEHGYHAQDGLGDIEEIKKFNANDIQVGKGPSILKYIEYILDNPGEVNLLLLGPTTNIAAAYMIEPKIVDYVKSVYIMGGSLRSRGNLNSTSEFNFSYDFIATKLVLDNFKNVIVTPWEPTENIFFRDEHIEHLTKTIIANEIKSVNEQVHLFVKLIVARYTERLSGIAFCDLYAANTVYNPKCVKKFSLCKFNICVDSREVCGLLTVKNRIRLDREFSELLKSGDLQMKYKGYHLVVEEMDEQKIFDDFEKIITHQN